MRELVEEVGRRERKTASAMGERPVGGRGWVVSWGAGWGVAGKGEGGGLQMLPRQTKRMEIWGEVVSRSEQGSVPAL